MKNVIIVFILLAMVVIISGCKNNLDTMICAYCEGHISWHMYGNDQQIGREYQIGKDGKHYHTWCYKLGVLPNE